MPFLLVFLHPFYFAKPFHSSFLANSKSSFWFCNYFFSFVTTSGHFTFKMNYLYQFYLKMVEFFESFIVQISQVHKNIYRIYGFVLILFFFRIFSMLLGAANANIFLLFVSSMVPNGEPSSLMVFQLLFTLLITCFSVLLLLTWGPLENSTLEASSLNFLSW